MISSKLPICLSLFLGFLLSSSAQEPELSPVSMQFKVNPTFITGMVQDQKGFVWSTDEKTGLFRYDGMHLVNFKSPYGENSQLECITIGMDGKIWVGSANSGLACFDPRIDSFETFQKDSTNSKSIRSNNIYALLADSSGGIWIGTNIGLDYYNPQANEFQHHFTNDPEEDSLQKVHINTLFFDKTKGVLWIGSGDIYAGPETSGGLFNLNLNKKTVTRYLHNTNENSLVDNRIRALFEDSKQNFWVGTGRGGLHLMNREEGTFKRIPYLPSHPEQLATQSKEPKTTEREHICFITEDNHGYIWLATRFSGIIRFDLEKKIGRHFGNNESGIYKLSREDFWTGLRTKDGLIWLSWWLPQTTNDKLLRIAPAPKKFTPVPLGQPIYCFAEDQSGKIYMGSKNMVTELINSGKIDTLEKINEFIPNGTVIQHLEIDSCENLWIPTFGNGLMKYNLQSKELKAYRADSQTGSGNDTILTTLVLNNNNILIGAIDGVYQLNLSNNKFIKYRFPDSIIISLNENNIHKFLLDSKKNIWIGGAAFLCRLELGKIKIIPYRLPGAPSAVILDLYEDSTSGLYVGSTNGLWRYDSSRDQFELVTDNSGIINSGTEIWAIDSDRKGKLWLETVDGIVKFNTKTNVSSLYGNNWGYTAWLTSNRGFFRSSNGEYYKGAQIGYLKFHPSFFENDGESNKPFVNKILVNDQLVPGIYGESKNIKLNYRQNDLSFELGFIDYLSKIYDQQYLYKLENYDNSWRSGENGTTVYYRKISPGSYLFRLKGMDFFGDWHEITIPIVITPPWYGTWWAITLSVLLFIAAIRAYIVYRSRKLRAEKKVLEQKVKERTLELEESLETVRSTQSQLIQSEKMASLGELTAGIAHEIQNPLNFVNNFSEVNRELLDEANTANETGNQSELRELLQNLKNNQEKIKTHGDRADAIVKSMLQHSRISSGQKESTDINALCDEYLRLAYHGMRAKDKSFNVKLETHLDHSLDKIKVVPQDIGRVLLNILNNSFHTVTEKAHLNEAGYIPEVKISTAHLNNKVEIKVKDNGMGIPEKIKEKIFQPFFTTKPAGQGTGLGLSLTYDIIRTHGGEINVNSKEGEGTEFAISLPVA